MGLRVERGSGRGRGKGEGEEKFLYKSTLDKMNL